MTPGEEALREAMRFEQARIYGHTCPEHRTYHKTKRDARPQAGHEAVDTQNGPRALRLIRVKTAS